MASRSFSSGLSRKSAIWTGKAKLSEPSDCVRLEFRDGLISLQEVVHCCYFSTVGRTWATCACTFDIAPWQHQSQVVNLLSVDQAHTREGFSSWRVMTQLKTVRPQAYQTNDCLKRFQTAVSPAEHPSPLPFARLQGSVTWPRRAAGTPGPGLC